MYSTDGKPLPAAWPRETLGRIRGENSVFILQQMLGEEPRRLQVRGTATAFLLPEAKCKAGTAGRGVGHLKG